MKTPVLILLMSLNLSAFAQLNCSEINYEISTFLEPYEHLNEEDVTSLTNGLVWDDPAVQFPIGFEFEYFNETTSELAFFEDFLGAGIVANPAGIKNAINLMLPAYADYTDLAYADSIPEGAEGGLSHISYLTEGEEGNRIFKLEWNNVGFFNEVSEGLSDSYLNVQMWLYEADNAIEFRYGDYNIEDPAFVFDGIQSTISALICSINTDGTSPSGIILGGDTEDPIQQGFKQQPDGFNDMPEINRVYRWERFVPVGVNEVSSELNISAFPMPFTEELNVSSSAGFDKIVLLDLNGKIVFQTTEFTEELTIDTSDLPPSIYLLRAEKEGTYITRKVVK